jgi:hypothetical protein
MELTSARQALRHSWEVSIGLPVSIQVHVPVDLSVIVPFFQETQSTYPSPYPSPSTTVLVSQSILK